MGQFDSNIFKNKTWRTYFSFSILPSSCSGRPTQQSMWIKLLFGFKDWDALKLPRRCAKYVSSERQSFPRLLVSRSHEELTMPRRAQLLEVVQSFLVMGIDYWCMFKALKSFSSVFAVWHVKKIGGLFFFWRWWPIWWHTKCVVHCEVPRGSEKCWSRMSKVGFETWGLDVCPFFHRMTKLFFPSISHDWTEKPWSFRLC